MKRVAILIDGAFYLKRIKKVCLGIDTADPVAVAKTVHRLNWAHLKHLNATIKLPGQARQVSNKQLVQHHRTLFYDALPYTGRVGMPISKKQIPFAKTPEAEFRLKLFSELRRQPNLALRLGECKISDPKWRITDEAMSDLRKGALNLSDLQDHHFSPVIQQKGVDTRLGLDLATMVLKAHADIFVLVAGDSDFVPVAKMARREGCHVILDPLWHKKVSSDLKDHIDGLYSGFPRPPENPAATTSDSG